MQPWKGNSFTKNLAYIEPVWSFNKPSFNDKYFERSEWGAFFDVNFFIILCSLTRKICWLLFSGVCIFFLPFMSYLSCKYMVLTVNLKLTRENKIPLEVFIYFYCQFWKQFLICSSCLLPFGINLMSFV